jgi:hypothetical protein
MPALQLTTAIATYGHTQPLKDRTLTSERVGLEHVDVVPITSAFRRSVGSCCTGVRRENCTIEWANGLAGPVVLVFQKPTKPSATENY